VRCNPTTFRQLLPWRKWVQLKHVVNKCKKKVEKKIKLDPPPPQPPPPPLNYLPFSPSSSRSTRTCTWLPGGECEWICDVVLQLEDFVIPASPPTVQEVGVLPCGGFAEERWLGSRCAGCRLHGIKRIAANTESVTQKLSWQQKK